MHLTVEARGKWTEAGVMADVPVHRWRPMAVYFPISLGYEVVWHQLPSCLHYVALFIEVLMSLVRCKTICMLPM